MAYTDAHRHVLIEGPEVRGSSRICAALKDPDVQFAPSSYCAVRTGRGTVGTCGRATRNVGVPRVVGFGGVITDGPTPVCRVELLEAFRTVEGVDLIRESVRMGMQELIEAETTEMIVAAKCERTETRITERNGYRDRLLATQAGDVGLRIPKLRNGNWRFRGSGGVVAGVGEGVAVQDAAAGQSLSRCTTFRVGPPRTVSDVAQWRLGQQNAWQGIRALAVVAVMCRHIGVLPGGWLGVEVFFVLSGFLITALLLDEAAEGSLRVSRFYLRRGARLLPALLLVLAAVLTFSVIVKAQARETAVVALATLFYSANWIAMTDQALAGLGHMWSLSIEEQFYLLWPLLLLLAYRRRGTVGVCVLAGAGALTCLILRALLSTGASADWYQRVYFGTDTRGAALLIGCVAGAVLHQNRGRAPRFIPAAVAWGAAAVVVTAVLLANPHSVAMWAMGMGVFDLAIVVVLAYLVDSRGIMARLLSIRPLVCIGEISYGVYLWHLAISWSLIQVGRFPLRFQLMVVLPFVLAALSYRFIETPIRRRVRGEADPEASGVDSKVSSM